MKEWQRSPEVRNNNNFAINKNNIIHAMIKPWACYNSTNLTCNFS